MWLGLGADGDGDGDGWGWGWPEREEADPPLRHRLLPIAHARDMRRSMPQINPSAAPSPARDELSSSLVLRLQLPCLQSVAADRGEWEGRVDNDMRTKG
jgi:hypothetical protein